MFALLSSTKCGFGALRRYNSLLNGTYAKRAG